jgi:WS/DGAT/MGAT family acyltransferase
MKQLGILDSAFVNLEQTNTPQHVGGLGIYDPSTAPGGQVRFKDVIATFQRRLDSHPLFRTRLVEVPGGLDRPYWVKDANFDVEFHLRHIALPEPGDWRQLCIQVARLHSRPIDMSRPLWEAYIIEGLDNIPNLPEGCFAIYTKMHHALVDGAGGSSFLTLLHDLVPNPDTTGDEADSAPRLVDSEPSMSELLSKASINSVKNSLQFAASSFRNTRSMGKYLLDLARKELPAPDLSAPKTLLNKPVGPHRVFDAAEFPLAGFNDIKKAGGCTFNDVALAVISGALQRYLAARGETPEGSLAASLPLNMRTRRDVSDDNNQVGAIFTSLHTDEKDPRQRLQLIKASTADAKRTGEASPLVDILNIAGAVAPVIVRSAAGFWSRNQLSRYLPLNISTVISNVAGPDFPLYCAGARMVDYYGLGVLTPGMGLFHLVFSYSGKVTLSVLADRDIMPDPQLYHDYLVQSYEELYSAVPVAAGTGGASKPGTKSLKRERPSAAGDGIAAGKRRKTAAPTAGRKSAGASKAKAGAKVKSAGTRIPTKAAARTTAGKTRAATAAKVKAGTASKGPTRRGGGASKTRPKAVPKLKHKT